MSFGVISLLLAMAAFAGILLWTFSKGKKKDFEEAARIPLDDGDDSEFISDVKDSSDDKSMTQGLKDSNQLKKDARDNHNANGRNENDN